jgi:hypothetical protein
MNIKSHKAILATLLTIVLIVAIYMANAQLTNTAIIKNTGQISTTTIWAKSGSAEDIQSAVDAVAAAGGGTVYVPAGTFEYPPSVFKTGITEWNPAVKIPGGVNVIGAGMNETILVQTEEGGNPCFFEIDGQNGKPARVSGFKFKGKVVTELHDNCGIAVARAKDFRIDHCAFEDFCGEAISSFFMSGYIHRGVIDHCTIDNPYKENPYPEKGYWDWAYGIGINGGKTWMSLDDLLGKYENNVVYIEDNTFARCRYAVAANTGGFYVFRYNNVTVSKPYNSFGKAGLDCHAGGDDYPGARGLEAYNNTIVGGGGTNDQAFKMRGGGGVIFNNTIQNVSTGVWLIKEDLPNNEQHYVKNLYIWGNTYVNVGTQLDKDSFYQENIHYFLYVKAGYMPYMYPHPLALETSS